MKWLDTMTKSKSFLQNLVKPFTSRKDQNEADLKEIAAQAQKQFSFETLAKATNNFHLEQKLGEGGFGPVFKGRLADGRLIAVKKLSQRSSQGTKEFKNEANLLALVQHRNVVNLLGYCVKGAEKLLVYEYVANESLDKLLFVLMCCNNDLESHGREVLDWNRRRDMITGIAKGLLYLHEDAHCCIIHRDIKASNILLDENWVPKIADFGLARLYPEDQTHINTGVAGTNGYMAPEYLRHGNLSVKADVFSFGVVVLELISGQKNSTFNLDPDSQSLLEWAYKLYKKYRVIEVMDPTLGPSSDIDQISMFIQIGLLCTQADPHIRPDMRRVVILLSRKPTVLDDPVRPGYTDSRYRKPRKLITSFSETGSSGESNSNSFGSTIDTQTATGTASTSRFTSKILDSKKGKQRMQS
ncbi:cysteine-rich receptor-like protein kinase 43 isoform X1 [Primulina tabacum]|uniref:cysteine-rich receptor-like protein kinase 43 isoform X1 n=1 Tax=Primulina tabacum TaxID=48773 RepID=UPI003F59C5E1